VTSFAVLFGLRAGIRRPAIGEVAAGSDLPMRATGSHRSGISETDDESASVRHVHHLERRPLQRLKRFQPSVANQHFGRVGMTLEEQMAGPLAEFDHGFLHASARFQAVDERPHGDPLLVPQQFYEFGSNPFMQMFQTDR
jgi:hypothetical protein